ncbi:MAG: hypothetical protein WD851_10680 [Pirellulales bacterium]
MQVTRIDADLTNDERYLRSMYLNYAPRRFNDAAYELGFILPAILFAGFAIHKIDAAPLWIAFTWILGCYLWRVANPRWARAFSGLIKKYDARIELLESHT